MDNSKVSPKIARRAMELAHSLHELYPMYTIMHHRDTGEVIPNCSEAELLNWLDDQEDVPDRFRGNNG